MNNVVIMPLALALAIIFALAALYRFRDILRRRKERHYIYKCSNCSHIYLYAKNMPMQSCPKCGHLNEIFRQ